MQYYQYSDSEEYTETSDGFQKNKANYRPEFGNVQECCFLLSVTPLSLTIRTVTSQSEKDF